MTITYTDAEKVTKKYTVKQAVDAAKAIMFERYKISNIETGFLTARKLADTTMITIVELNEISDTLVYDTKVKHKLR